MTAAPITPLEAALAATGRGWFVFPLAKGGKVPALKRWPAKSSADPAQVQTWATRFPGCNWGVHLGKSGLVVVDVDRHKEDANGFESLAALEAERGSLPATFTVATPNAGQHRYFLGQGLAHEPCLAAGLELRTGDHYVVLPGSVQEANGLAWTVTEQRDPVPIPEGWAKTASKGQPSPEQPILPPLCADAPQDIHRATDYLKTAAPAIEGQQGDLATFQLFAQLRDLGLTQDTALELAAAHWNPRCEPPWDPEELASKCANAFRYAKQPAGCASLAAVTGVFGPIPQEPRTPEGSEAQAPVLVRSLGEVRADPETNGGNLLGQRFLCRGGGLLLAAPTGIGKSTLSVQAAILWALGRDIFGIAPSGPLRLLIIQAENDDGDLAELRDGIATGLGLTPEERARAFERVKIACESAKTGQDFVRLLDRVLASSPADLVIVDPLFAYLGDSVAEQKAVSSFLRNGLNPVLVRHRCGLVLVHHTNKPAQGREKAEWKAGDFAYLGSGSAELANWARAVVGIRSIGDHSVFQVVFGKRGKRAGIVDDNGNPVFSLHIKHAAQGICWQLAEPGDIPAATTASRAKIKPHDVAEAIPQGGEIAYGKLADKLAAAFGVTSRTARTAIEAAQKAETVIQKGSGLYQRKES